MHKIGMTEYKYVIMHVVVKETEMDFPFIFPRTMIHQHIAVEMRALIKAQFSIQDVNDITVRSAGTITFGNVHCAGKSDSLGIASQTGDADIVKVNPYTAGINDGGYTIALIKRAEEQYRKDHKNKVAALKKSAQTLVKVITNGESFHLSETIQEVEIALKEFE